MNVTRTGRATAGCTAAVCFLVWLCLPAPLAAQAAVGNEDGTLEQPAENEAVEPAATSPNGEARGTEEGAPSGDAAPSEPGAGEQDEAGYVENSWLRDFEVHFFVSLPFTALYSYLTVLSLDGLVQGEFPTEFRQADSWVVIGLALGSSLAVALGSAGRVPDQSQYQLAPAPKNETRAVPEPEGARLRLAGLTFVF